MSAPLSLRARIGAVVDHPRVQYFIMAIIVLNAISLGMETSGVLTAKYGAYLLAFDVFALSVFCVEIAAKLAHRGLRFFKDGWNVFDFLVVAIALVPASGPLAVLRAMRILRALRLLTVVPAMKRVVGALISALPGMGSVFSIIFLVFYVAAVLTTNFFGETFPDWFGTIGASLYTLFQVMTLESWSMGIVRPVMEVHPYAWLFFVPFIMITTFAIVNLFIGIIVDAMQSQHTVEQEVLHAENKELLAGEDAILAEIRALREEVRALRKQG
ncbi:ion transporter [Magnetovibrio sp.]|uniref:ion transporter n=1 Tax=Magnetovibrio sp. TaxID=2024836 RepID=UPI002F94E82D